MKNRRATTRDKMYGYYRRWESSGMSVTGFAKSQGVPASTFYYWCKKFSEQVNTDQDINRDTGFEPLNLTSMGDPTAIAQPKAVIRFPTGVSVEWYGSDPSEMFGCLSTMGR